MMAIYKLRYRVLRWWRGLLWSLLALLLLSAFFVLSVFALFAVVLLGSAGTIYVWWQRRKRRGSVKQDIFLKEYRVLGGDSQVLQKDQEQEKP